MIEENSGMILPFALLTLHRPSNVDEKQILSKIVEALVDISHRIPIVFPVHPRTRKQLKAFGLEHYFKNSLISGSKQPGQGIYLIEPVGYLDFLNLEMNASFVLTDSGGIQEEITVLDIPCLTLRNTTERPITITGGTNILVWNHTQKIIEEAFKILDGKSKRGNCPQLWDGKTAERIIGLLADKTVRTSI